MTRQAYMRALQARMEQLERVPTKSFFHSYAGEFDVRFCIILFYLAFMLSCCRFVHGTVLQPQCSVATTFPLPKR